jgi:cytidylate kinase
MKLPTIDEKQTGCCATGYKQPIVEEKMPIIALFSNLPEFAQGVSRVVAEKTGYKYVSDADLIRDAAKRYSVAEETLARTVECKPGVLHRLCSTRDKHMAWLESVLAERLLEDNILLSGFIGYPLLEKVSHVFKVRLLCGIKDLIELSKLVDIPRDQLGKGIKIKEDNYRSWVQYLYGADISDSSLYDMTLNVGNLNLDEAIDSILHTVGHERFQPMTFSLGCVRDQVVSSRVKAYLVDLDPRAEIKSKEGMVYVYSRGSRFNRKNHARKIKEELIRLEGVKQVEVYCQRELFKSVSCGH